MLEVECTPWFESGSLFIPASAWHLGCTSSVTTLRRTVKRFADISRRWCGQSVPIFEIARRAQLMLSLSASHASAQVLVWFSMVSRTVLQPCATKGSRTLLKWDFPYFYSKLSILKGERITQMGCCLLVFYYFKIHNAMSLKGLRSIFFTLM